MGIRKSANDHGYTLMELIMALAIISITSAVAIPNYARYIADTREKICMINRQTIINEYELYCISEQEISLSDYIHKFYEGYDGCLCPSGGIITPGGFVEEAELTCSKHRKLTAEAVAKAALNPQIEESVPAIDIPYSSILQ